MSFAAKLIGALTEMGPLKANLVAMGAMGAGSFVCCMTQRAIYADALPGTFKSSLWSEATAAYLKFQGADPISHPENAGFKQ